MMNHSLDKNDIEKQPSYLQQMRFKEVPTDKERIYNKVVYRMMHDNPVMKGVSVVWKYASVAAMFALLILSSYLIFMPKESEPVELPIAYVEISSIKGSKTKVLLPDSSIVWLKGASSIRYPQQFSADSRKVSFTGEALFDIQHDRSKPFVVDADGMEIKVLGTLFNVWSDQAHVETTLLEGAVELSVNHQEKALCVLSPNQQAIYDRTNHQLSINRVKAEAWSAWVTGKFHFEKNTLQEIVAQLERAFEVKIHISRDKLRQQRYNAQFIHQESLDEILSVLQIPARYQYKREKGEIYIY